MPFFVISSEQHQEEAAADRDADLAGDVGSHRVHQEEVGRILFLPHLLDNARRHREGAYAGGDPESEDDVPTSHG